MLEFLRFAGYNTPININKMNYSVNVIPNELNGLEHTELKTQVIPRVIDKLKMEHSISLMKQYIP